MQPQRAYFPQGLQQSAFIVAPDNQHLPIRVRHHLYQNVNPNVIVPDHRGPYATVSNPITGGCVEGSTYGLKTPPRPAYPNVWPHPGPLQCHPSHSMGGQHGAVKPQFQSIQHLQPNSHYQVLNTHSLHGPANLPLGPLMHGESNEVRNGYCREPTITKPMSGFQNAPSMPVYSTNGQNSTDINRFVKQPCPNAVNPNCKRNPPPPPPPRSGSWLGGIGSNHTCPVAHTNAAVRPPPPVAQHGCSVNNTPERAGCLHLNTTSSTNRCAGPPNTVSEANRTRHSTPCPLVPVMPARAEVTDTLLRLLIYHFTADHSARVGLDRLLHAVCGVRTSENFTRFADSELAGLADRILPHLVRIIYSEALADEPNSQGSHSCRNDSVGANGRAIDSSIRSRDTASTDEMTTSMESRQSCAEDDDEEDEEDEDGTAEVELEDEAGPNDVDAVLDVLEEKSGLSCASSVGDGTADSLPAGTSIAELKSAAIEAIQRLVPIRQADCNLRDRDLSIVRLLVTIHTYTSTQRHRLTQFNHLHASSSSSSGLIHAAPQSPVAEVAALVRLSFYPEHRTTICDLGGLHALIGLLRQEQAIWKEPHLTAATAAVQHSMGSSESNGTPAHTNNTGSARCSLETSMALRRYVCMALTNLTFGVAANKALLCRRPANLDALLAQLEAGNEELKQVSASVLRNLCWRTDSRSKAVLRRVHAPRRLTMAAMTAQRDNTLRTTLSALWNLSAHCSHNKRAVCSVKGVFPFLLGIMHCEDELMNRLVIVENSGGILRNISTVVAGREDYRSLLHQNNCFPILVNLLRNSPSLTVVVNVCGTLWNLTASPHCPASDLIVLCRLGVVDLLHHLSHSSHELIRTSSTAVLRNLMHPGPETPVTMNRGIVTSNTELKPIVSNTETQNEERTRHVTNPVDDSSELDYDGFNEPNQDSVNKSDQACRRRVNPRAHLRFGLLSVVLEANDADEEQAAEDYDDEEDDLTEEGSDGEETCEENGSDGGLDQSYYPDQEALVTDVSSELLEDVVESSKHDEEDAHCRWNASDNVGDQEEEEACVYADEGTPFPPDSTRASCAELYEPTKRHFNPVVRSGGYLSGEFNSYTSMDALPCVYAVEDTPSQEQSICPSAYSSSPPGMPKPVKSSVETYLVDNGCDEYGDEDATQLPSPPPDIPHLPLMHLRAAAATSEEEEVGINFGFRMPPPPLGSSTDAALAAMASVVHQSALETPLMFSRGTSSYLSSADLADSPVACESSLHSGSGSPPSGLPDSDFTDSSPYAEKHAERSRPDSAIEIEMPVCLHEVDDIGDGNVHEEVRLPFAEEGTPQDALSLMAEPDFVVQNHCGMLERTNNVWPASDTLSAAEAAALSHTHLDIDGEVGDDHEEDDEQGESHILQQCIASAMPKNPSRCTPMQYTTKANDNVLFEQTDDSVQAFAVEDTPFGTSTKNSSLSDLFGSDQKSTQSFQSLPQIEHPLLNGDESRGESCLHGSVAVTRHTEEDRVSSSTSSSINEESSSDLLSKVIQSAMPKSSIRNALNNLSLTDGDCVQLYALEGTPGNEALSGSSSSSGSDKSSTQPSLRSVNTTESGTSAALVMSDSVSSGPPPPPRRTSSVPSTPKDPFAPPTGQASVRPQATVAPMPQVPRSSPPRTEQHLNGDYSVTPDACDSQKPRHSIAVEPVVVSQPEEKPDDGSSFSSLLSIESVGLEHSLLQECICSAMPRPKSSSASERKLRQPSQWQPLLSDTSVEPGTTTKLGELGTSGSETTTKERSKVHASSAPLTNSSSVGTVSRNSVVSLGSELYHSTTRVKQQQSTQLRIPIGIPAVKSNTSSTTSKRNGAVNFLGLGSGDALRLHPCYSPATKMTMAAGAQNTATCTVPPPPSNRLINRASSEVKVTTDTDGQKFASKSTYRRASATIANETNIDSVAESCEAMLAQGFQDVLTALRIDSTPLDSDGKTGSNEAAHSPSVRLNSTTKKTTAESHLSSILPPMTYPSSRLVKPAEIPSSLATTTAAVTPHSQSKLVTPSVIPTPLSKLPVVNSIKSTTNSRHPPSQNEALRGSTSALSKQRSGIKQPTTPYYYRSAMTCPPSANSRSPCVSRSVSAMGSQNNLARRSQPVSAQSVQAALSKQEKTLKARPLMNKSNAATPSSIRQGISRGTPIRQQTTSPADSKSVVNSIPHLPNTSVGVPICGLEDGPKPVRGGRKSLTGRKPIQNTASGLTKPVNRTTSVGPRVSIPNGALPKSKTTTLGNPNGTGASRLPAVSPTSSATSANTTTKSSNGKLAQVVAKDSTVEKSEPSGLWIVRGELSLVDGVS